MSHVKIATAPCSWGVWYADGTPSGTPWPLFLDQAAAAGYQALELGPDGYLPTDNGVLRVELDKRGLSVCAGTACYAFDKESFGDFRPRVEVLCRRLNEFGAKYLVTMDESDVGLYSEKKERFSAGVWSGFFEKICLLGEYTQKEFGIEVVYHPHIKSMVETETEILRLMDATGLNLCLDIGHHAYVNAPWETSPLTFLQKHAVRVSYLHFKNMDRQVFGRVREQGLDSDTAFDIDVMCDLEDGIVEYGALKTALDNIGFAGVGVIEQDMPRATTDQAFAAAKRNLDYLRRIRIID